MTKINLPLLGLHVESETWDSLIRQYAIENQHEGGFLANNFLELTVDSSAHTPDAALTDALDLIKFNARKRFADALQKKYRIGTEFSEDSDAHEIFDKAFVSAEATAMGALGQSGYSFDTMLYTELFYWVTLQLLRMVRGEYVDRKYQGNQARLGANLDLAGSAFSGLSSQFYEDE